MVGSPELTILFFFVQGKNVDLKRARLFLTVCQSIDWNGLNNIVAPHRIECGERLANAP